MTIYSYSRLSAFKQCPLKYRFSYIDRRKDRRKTIEAFMGNRFHEAMEYLYKRVRYEEVPAETLKHFYQTRWNEEWDDAIRIVSKERTAENYRAIGLKALEDYYHQYHPFEKGHILGLERELLLPLDDGGTYRMRCIIDRLMRADDGSMSIHDYKTSGFLPTQEQVDADEQLALYEMAVRAAWPNIAQIDLVWHYVVFDMEMRSSRTSEQLAALRAQTIALIRHIESVQDFPPQESHLCEWCDFQPSCPLFAHRFHVVSLSLEEYAESDEIALVNRSVALDHRKHELQAELRRIEEEQERLKRAASRLAMERGVLRLFGDTHLLTIREDLRISYPKKGDIERQAFESFLRDQGLWEEVVDLSWSALKACLERHAWKREEDLPEGLAPYLHLERVPKVRLSKRKGEEVEGE